MYIVVRITIVIEIIFILFPLNSLASLLLHKYIAYKIANIDVTLSHIVVENIELINYEFISLFHSVIIASMWYL